MKNIMWIPALICSFESTVQQCSKSGIFSKRKLLIFFLLFLHENICCASEPHKKHLTTTLSVHALIRKNVHNECLHERNKKKSIALDDDLVFYAPFNII